MLEEERIIDGRTASPNEENVDRALRPSLLTEYALDRRGAQNDRDSHGASCDA